MDLEAPLRTIASPVEAEVLRVLAGADTEFTAPQVHRLAPDSTPFGIRKALGRLKSAGLVVSDRYGNTTTWRANRRHVLWPAVEIAANARREVLDRLRSLLEQRSEVAAYLYGSFARRESTPDSDVDVLLVFPDDEDSESMIDFAHDVSEGIENWTGNPGQVFNATRSWLREALDRGDPIMDSIRHDAVPVAGPGFRDFVRVLEAEHRARG